MHSHDRSAAAPRASRSFDGRPEWQPSLGAWFEGGHARFRVWAPTTLRVEVVVEGLPPQPLERDEAGYWTGTAASEPGAEYRYLVAGRELPDPASRYQPHGVHGRSELIDPSGFEWTDAAWTGVELRDLVIYEVHVGTATSAGTFSSLRERLAEVRRLGVTAIELMPVADFAGDRNWGYDGVDLFAPARAYGRPDDLRSLVDAAHAHGLGVILDVVYNHLGPEGAYLASFSPQYFSTRHASPWGAAVNLDEPGCEHVRRFFIENALHWLHEYHVDGFRLDATHALRDESPRHFLDELRAALRAAHPGVILIAEDDRKAPELTAPAERGGWGLDAVWADDFHHHLRRLLAGDREGYFARYSGTVADLARTVQVGYTFREPATSRPLRGTAPADPPEQFVICLQNHDQVGNRAMGDRLHHTIGAAEYRAASTLLLCAPETPLLFMGQEWAASSPFCYFTDHPPDLGRLVTAGRRNEFKAFSAFADPVSRERIPDPQAASTFDASVLQWEQRTLEPHAAVLRLYEALLHVRRTLFAPGVAAVRATDEGSLVIERPGRDGGTVLVAVRLRGVGAVPVGAPGEGSCLEVEAALTTEHPAFAADPSPPEFTVDAGGRPVIVFARPGAFIGTCGLPRRRRPDPAR